MSDHTYRATDSGRLERRGLMAGVAVLVGAGIAKVLGAERAEAGHTGAPDNVLHLEVTNNQGGSGETSTGITSTTSIVGAVPGTGGQAVLRVVQLRTDDGVNTVALEVQGPALESISDFPGIALAARGGNNGAGLAGGRGLLATGGAGTTGAAGIGADVSGGNSMSGQGGAGLLASGGGSTTGSGGRGVVAFGASGNPPGVGVQGTGGGTTGSQAHGVLGQTNSATNAGVIGTNSGTGPGVRGQSGATGAGSGTGVHGDASDIAPSAVGVLGTGYLGVFGHATQFGVYGFATGAGAQGFHAEAQGGIGCVAVGQQGFFTEGTGPVGLEARCISGTAVLGVSNSGLAGRYIGPVLVEGSFTATGIKSAAVPHPDGSHRRLYCEESTESWFSDYGEGRLVNGRAEVQLDPDFDAVVHGDNYQVFLTARGDCRGLYVSEQRAHRFEVREAQGGTSTLAFNYRVVAKRRDIEGRRLERVSMPAPPGRPRVDGIERPQERGRSGR
jgi:hypothetical protein